MDFIKIAMKILMASISAEPPGLRPFVIASALSRCNARYPFAEPTPPIASIDAADCCIKERPSRPPRETRQVSSSMAIEQRRASRRAFVYVKFLYFEL